MSTPHAPAISAEAAGNAAEVVAAFNAKAITVAQKNGWTVDYAKQVMLGYLRNHDPQTAGVVTVSLLVAA